MRLHNEFTVPAPPDEVLAALLDVERMAPCVPGAVLDWRDGCRSRGRLRLRIGPAVTAYAGEVRLRDVDHQARRVRLEASGSETTGTGSARGQVDAEVVGDGWGSRVRLTTDLRFQGKAARFGRAVLADVSERVVEQFARNLEALLVTVGAGTAVEPPVAPAPGATPGGATPAVARRAARAAPLLTIFAAGLVVGARLRDRRTRSRTPG